MLVADGSARMKAGLWTSEGEKSRLYSFGKLVCVWIERRAASDVWPLSGNESTPLPFEIV